MRAVVRSLRPVTNSRWYALIDVESETWYGAEYSVALIIEVRELREPRSYERVGLAFRIVRASCSCRAAAFKNKCKHIDTARIVVVEKLKSIYSHGLSRSSETESHDVG
jgi:hypothetical protein